MARRVLVAFRPEQPTDTPDRPLDRGIAYMVVTFEEGQITELKGCADRTVPPRLPTRRRARCPSSRCRSACDPESVPEPPERRVSRLVPFVRVAEVERSGEPIDPARQGALFYLYSDDLPALREQLLAADIPAGAIEDGSPGPREEMRLTDPDGYVLMVAQID